MSPFFKGVALVAMSVAILGCGNVSHNIAKDGRSAGEVVWPLPDDVTPMHKGGTFPNLANLGQMHDGLNKAQVSHLIGYPHFNEGVWGVHEWNYLFNFRRLGTEGVTVCQYKVLFDDDRIARRFYWKPASCVALLENANAGQPAHVKKPESDVVTLSADALFPFDRAEAKDVMPAGRTALSALAARWRASDAGSFPVRIIGYTDNIGSTAHNMDLSQRRAQAVRDILVEERMPAVKLIAEGRGEADPVKVCDDVPRVQRIACLAPNRRVWVRFDSE